MWSDTLFGIAAFYWLLIGAVLVVIPLVVKGMPKNLKAGMIAGGIISVVLMTPVAYGYFTQPGVTNVTPVNTATYEVTAATDTVAIGGTGAFPAAVLAAYIHNFVAGNVTIDPGNRLITVSFHLDRGGAGAASTAQGGWLFMSPQELNIAFTVHRYDKGWIDSGVYVPTTVTWQTGSIPTVTNTTSGSTYSAVTTDSNSQFIMGWTDFNDAFSRQFSSTAGTLLPGGSDIVHYAVEFNRNAFGGYASAFFTVGKSVQWPLTIAGQTWTLSLSRTV